ncbi:MAG: hypothetical protein ABSF94_12180 [Steroidobacteraceae bacterium]|jgi:hypothetical protein
MNTKSVAIEPQIGLHGASRGGVWIDHRKAVIVGLTPHGARTQEILSDVQKHPERGGDSPLKGAYEARQVPADDRRQFALTGELNGFYDAVIAAIGEFGRVLILGPGEAKGELQARLVHRKLGDRVVAVETEDKLSDPQIVAKVRSHFGVEPPRLQTR